MLGWKSLNKKEVKSIARFDIVLPPEAEQDIKGFAKIQNVSKIHHALFELEIINYTDDTEATTTNITLVVKSNDESG